jgi:hypothetical protein
MTTPPPTELSVTGYPKGGRPPKVTNSHRWHLIVDREERDRAAARAQRKGHGDLTDVMRALMHAYAAGQLDGFATKDTPSTAPTANGHDLDRHHRQAVREGRIS